MVPTQIAALAVVSSAAAFDVRTRRIPNLLTFGGALAAFVYHGWMDGWSGLLHSVEGWGVATLLFLPMFLLRGLGAGDVKLLGAVGALLGPMGAVRCAFLSVMAGGLMALVVGLRHRYLAQAFRNLWGLLGFWRVAGLQPQPGLTIDDSTSPRLPYGLAIALGTVGTVFWK